MAENIPNAPGGALPPKKETGKVQPKKETVRITLPPKPTAAPTIKLPTLPPGGPTGAASPAMAATPAASPAPLSPPPASRATAAPVAAPKPASAPAPRPAPAAARSAPTVGGLDKTLALAAAIIGLVAVGSVVYLMLIPT
ncbi:MAG: hypothetical protein EPO07_13630 [Verrucomicrobia bacterium]|nr:MAG: hypothetical protein EPO07_13630 [Verrucomicrobiota bacterium]